MLVFPFLYFLPWQEGENCSNYANLLTNTIFKLANSVAETRQAGRKFRLRILRRMAFGPNKATFASARNVKSNKLKELVSFTVNKSGHQNKSVPPSYETSQQNKITLPLATIKERLSARSCRVQCEEQPTECPDFRSSLFKRPQ